MPEGSPVPPSADSETRELYDDLVRKYQDYLEEPENGFAHEAYLEARNNYIARFHQFYERAVEAARTDPENERLLQAVVNASADLRKVKTDFPLPPGPEEPPPSSPVERKFTPLEMSEPDGAAGAAQDAVLDERTMKALGITLLPEFSGEEKDSITPQYFIKIFEKRAAAAGWSDAKMATVMSEKLNMCEISLLIRNQH